jgi:hypothetical protein
VVTRFGVLEFYDLIRMESGSFKSEEDLWQRARTLDAGGDRALMQFMLGRRDLPQLMARVFKAEHALETSTRQKQSRAQIIQLALATKPCQCPSPGRWLQAANEVLLLNGFAQEIQHAVLTALEHGRAKGRTIFIIGDTNRAKSFLLKPLSTIFQAYAPPDSGSHQLADLQGSEVIWLNDFAFDPAWMPWAKLKACLEGEPLKVAVPKTQGCNYIFSGDAPVFGTAPHKVQHPASHKETAQVDSRIKYFTFHHYFNPDTCPEIKPCERCFAQWLTASLPVGPFLPLAA